MSALMKGLKGLACPASSPAPSESGRKKRARRGARTSLARSTPRMLCVNTRCPTGPSRAKRPPRSASPQKVGESLCLHHSGPNSRRWSTPSRIGARFRAHAAKRSGWNSAPTSQVHLHQTSLLRDWSSTSNLGTTTFLSTTENSSQYKQPGTGIAADTSALYLQAGAGSISNAIVDAQLTHPVRRDDDAEMPRAPLAHDILTPRRRVGGRCRKWAVSTQQPADKRRCASCITCGLQFAHGEARLQQWCHRESNNAYVHAQLYQRRCCS